MLLAEALADRAESQNHLKKLAERLVVVARVQDGDVPEEDPRKLLEDAQRLFEHIEDLVRRINATNAATPFDENLTLTDAIAKRDSALQQRRFYTQLADAATRRQDRYSRSEIKFIATMDVAWLRTQADQASKEYRLLDTKIQQLNWNTELIEL
ncbi:hypothetical protein EML15_05365 [Corynebacterium sp. sy017]|uniref:DIP1984 family protein n=1 Tax=unclassified Corynebacterium TaxID=2624378 RepID=UPI001185C6F7|nr:MULTISPECIES: DIP1984 family protein [unclassified Corynebacterium]MBP3088575.1 hypothetical protein [Corynebacterium sp. sy017]QDZ41986.1 hypothetical protein FQV43_01485 [Corynebacterium sp. sy039]TSD91872.1 hypothetical protein ELY17_05365 [Corynebacterium sp. SY003]